MRHFRIEERRKMVNEGRIGRGSQVLFVDGWWSGVDDSRVTTSISVHDRAAQRNG